LEGGGDWIYILAPTFSELPTGSPVGLSTYAMGFARKFTSILRLILQTSCAQAGILRMSDSYCHPVDRYASIFIRVILSLTL